MTEDEWSELEERLALLPECFQYALPADTLHGFLTAVVMGAESVSAEALLPYVLDYGTPEPCRSGLPADAAQIIRLLHTMIGDIDAQLDDPDHYLAPMARIYPSRGEELADASFWCAGFMLGMNHAHDSWLALRALIGMEQAIKPIYRLGFACEALRRDVVRTHPGPVPSVSLNHVQCDELTGQLPETVDAIWVLITDHRVDCAMAAMERAEETPAWQDFGPCPCGSGEIFERCCGTQRVLH